LNRVELLLPGEDIPEAARVFNDVLGGHLPPPHEVAGQQVASTIDYALGIEFYGPSNPDSPRNASFERKTRRGAVGPLVWEVDDLGAAKQEVIDKGYRVAFEYGEPGRRQVHLDPDQLFGYGVTFTERRGDGVGERPTRVRRFQRVELLMAGDDIEQARTIFNDLLGADIPPVRRLADQEILTTADLRIGIELFGPSSPASVVQARLDRKGRGAIGPLVWEVDDLDRAKSGALEKGYRVAFEYGEAGVRQVHLDDEQLFGYGITFTERG
jgi:hypothetical protein